MQGVAYRNDGDDPMSEVLSDYCDHKVTVILREIDEDSPAVVATGVLTYVAEDDEYRINAVQFRKKDVDMLIVFE